MGVCGTAAEEATRSSTRRRHGSCACSVSCVPALLHIPTTGTGYPYYDNTCCRFKMYGPMGIAPCPELPASSAPQHPYRPVPRHMLPLLPPEEAVRRGGLPALRPQQQQGGVHWQIHVPPVHVVQRHFLPRLPRLQVGTCWVAAEDVLVMIRRDSAYRFSPYSAPSPSHHHHRSYAVQQPPPFRYGLELEEVRADPNWICAHCYEEEHGPWEKHGWFCNRWADGKAVPNSNMLRTRSRRTVGRLKLCATSIGACELGGLNVTHTPLPALFRSPTAPSAYQRRA